MSVVMCPLCSERLDNNQYDNHMAWRHPDFETGWWPPVTVKKDEPKKEEVKNDEQRQQ